MLTKRWLAVVAICLSLFIGLALIKFFQIRAAIAFGESFPEPSETVHRQTVEYSKWQPFIKVSGEVRAPQEVELRTEIAGVIAKIGFEPGGRVKAGDVLLKLDSAEEEARLTALQPQIKLAEKDLTRLSGIKNRQAVSQQLIDQARSQLGVVRGEAASIRESIANKTIIAPFSGTSGLHDFQPGEYLSSGTTVTRLIGENDELWVDFSLPQQHANLKTGQSITITANDLFEGQRPGRVSVVEPALSRDTRSLGVRAVFANIDNAITPGSFVNVLAPTGGEQTVIRLPSTAVRTNSFGNYVFTLERDEQQQLRAKRKPVKVLAKVGNDSILAPDLSQTDVVATLGAYKLREGLLVKLTGDDAVAAELEVQNLEKDVQSTPIIEASSNE